MKSNTLLIIIMVFVCGNLNAQNSLWLHTNYNFATFIERNPNKPQDGQTQKNYSEGAGVGLLHRHTINKRWALESSFTYQKKGYKTTIEVGDFFNPLNPNLSRLTLHDNYHFIDINEVVWYNVLNYKKLTFNIGAGLGLGMLVGYHKGTDFWLLNDEAIHNEYINTKPKSFAPFRYVGAEVCINNKLKIGFDNKNDIGRFIKSENFEAKNWVWSLNVSYNLNDLFGN